MEAAAKPKFLIKITRYINPHKFFFKLEFNLSDFERDVEELLTMHGTSMRHHANMGYAPKINEIVLVFMQSWNKWIRAKCDSIAEYASSERKFILWALDDGIPFMSAKQWIYPLPEELRNMPARSIFVGGLNNIIPMERKFNMDEMQSENIVARDWTELAVKNVADLFDEAAEIWFKPEAKCGNYCFGSIMVKTFSGERVDPSAALIEHNFAKLSNNFGRDLMEMDTLAKARFDKNNGVMDAIVQNCKTYVERECFRPPNVIHEFDAKFDGWTVLNEQVRKSAENECHRQFQQALDELFTINLTVADPFVSLDPSIDTNYQFKVAGKNHLERLQALNRLKMRRPHRQSMGSFKSIDNYESLTKRDLSDINRRDQSDARSVVSTTSTVFTNKQVFLRALDALRMLQIDSSDEADSDDGDVDAEFEKTFFELQAKPNVPVQNPIVCVPSGHETHLAAFEKANMSSPNMYNNERNGRGRRKPQNYRQQRPAMN